MDFDIVPQNLSKQGEPYESYSQRCEYNDHLTLNTK